MHLSMLYVSFRYSVAVVPRESYGGSHIASLLLSAYPFAATSLSAFQHRVIVLLRSVKILALVRLFLPLDTFFEIRDAKSRWGLGLSEIF